MNLRGFTNNNLWLPAPLKSFVFLKWFQGPCTILLGSSTWYTSSFFENDSEVPKLLLNWFQGGGQWLLNWSQGMASPCWKNDFNGWRFQTPPKSLQTWFQEGGEFNTQCVGMIWNHSRVRSTTHFFDLLCCFGLRLEVRQMRSKVLHKQMSPFTSLYFVTKTMLDHDHRQIRAVMRHHTIFYTKELVRVDCPCKIKGVSEN